MSKHAIEVSYMAVPVTVAYTPGDDETDPDFYDAFIGDVKVTEMLSGEQWVAIEKLATEQITGARADSHAQVRIDNYEFNRLGAH